MLYVGSGDFKYYFLGSLRSVYECGVVRTSSCEGTGLHTIWTSIIGFL